MKPWSRPIALDIRSIFPRQTRRGLIEARRSRDGSTRTIAHFPGRHAGASLKLGRPRADEGDGADFPGRHAGASLKRAGAAAKLVNATRPFPRQTRRGLIEARRPPRPAPSHIRDFPGRHAGASLKQRLPHRVRRAGERHFPGRHAGASLKLETGGRLAEGADRFPRQTRRGLIEAGRGRAGCELDAAFPRQTRRGLIEARHVAGVPDRHSRHFPGRHAGASLKRLGRRRAPEGGGHFPGRHAGASLKRQARTQCESRSNTFPRQTRRGLIEAMPPSSRRRPVHPHFPGRHAGASLKRQMPIRAALVREYISPADTPGPH